MPCDFGLLYDLGQWDAAQPERLENTLGVAAFSHLILPVVAGPHLSLRRHPPDDQAHFLEASGGWYFPPTGARYGGVDLQPRAARGLGRRNRLAEIVEFAQARGLRLIGRLGLRHVEALRAQAPSLVHHSAWGDRVPTCGVCPVQPQVRELVRCTLEDLASYGLHGVMLEGALPATPVVPLAAAPPGTHPQALEWLDVCFCAACRAAGERGGVDASAAARSAQVTITERIERPERSGLPTDEHLVAYRRAVAADQVVWLERLAQHPAFAGVELLVETRSGAAGVDPPGLSRVRTVFRVRDAESALRRPEPAPHVWSVRAGPPTFSTAAELVAWVHAAGSAGCARIDFEDCDSGWSAPVEWVRQAVRYGHRE